MTYDHGYARYRLDGCRCYVCAAAVSEYDRRRQMAITAGTWRMDAGLVREHLAVLSAAGMGYKRVAKVSGVSRSTVRRLLYGNSGRPAPSTTRHDIGVKLLTVEVDLGPSALVDGLGTVRRIQALAAIGWTLTATAAALGWTLQNLGTLLGQAKVTRRTADAVAALYEQRSGTPGPSRAARQLAARRGWVPPLAWNDIDDTDDKVRGVAS